VTEAVLTLASK